MKGGRFFPVLVFFQGSGLGELRPRSTRGDTSCRSLLGEGDCLWGMICHPDREARATLGARGKLGKTCLFLQRNPTEFRRWGTVGACGAVAAGSESQPYLEGDIEAVDLFGGRLGGARCLRIGFGEDRGTRSLPGWSLRDWALLGRRRGWVARGRRVGRPGLQGGGRLGEAALHGGRHRGGGFIWGRLGGARCLRIGFGEDRETRSLPGWSLPGWSLPEWALLWGGPWDTVPTGVVPTGVGLTGAARGWVARGRRVGRPGLQGAAGSERRPYLEGGIEAVELFGGRLGAARCLRIGFGEDRGTRSLPGWSLREWSLPGWALLGRREDGLLGGAGSGDPTYRGRLGRRGGPPCEPETETTTGDWQVVGSG